MDWNMVVVQAKLEPLAKDATNVGFRIIKVFLPKSNAVKPVASRRHRNKSGRVVIAPSVAQAKSSLITRSDISLP